MRIATVLTPPTDSSLQLASQLGVSDIVVRCPGLDLSDLIGEKNRIESFGMKASVVEGNLPIENIKLGNQRRDAEIEELKTFVRNMGRAGIKILCYNFMAGTDWVRTSLDAPERGGAKVTGFDLCKATDAVLLGESAEDTHTEVSVGALWANLEHMLHEIVPVAEEAGVVLAMHPDDPPLDCFMNKARIMNSVENFERLVSLVPSQSNAICFCQGTFAEMGVDISATIRRLGPHIAYVHFRDVRGTREQFVETFHDNGPTNMFAAIRAYRAVGFTGPMRPDHVPQLVGEEGGEPGYTMLGRIFAFGYMRGLIQAAEQV